MKIVLLCGAASNQCALANRLHEAVGLSGIAIWNPARTASRPMKRWFSAAAVRTIGMPLNHAWKSMQTACAHAYPHLPLPPALNVDNINAAEVVRWIGDETPDLVLVSGTNLLNSRTIEATRRTAPILNLHTGLSPYVRGGPNCTNWCLATGQPEMIGNTILWLDAGIDSGNLAATERTTLNGSETLGELHLKVMNHAHDLYARAVRQFVSTGDLPRIDQSAIAEGRTYYTREWTARRMFQAVSYHRTHYPRDIRRPRKEPVTVHLKPVIGSGSDRVL